MSIELCVTMSQIAINLLLMDCKFNKAKHSLSLGRLDSQRAAAEPGAISAAPTAVGVIGRSFLAHTLLFLMIKLTSPAARLRLNFVCKS